VKFGLPIRIQGNLGNILCMNLTIRSFSENGSPFKMEIDQDFEFAEYLDVKFLPGFNIFNI
jgi:hypothetical protein